MRGSVLEGMSSVQGLGQRAEVRAGTRTFSSVPSSRRSKEHEVAMIAALLSDVV